jgi:putative tryptophan/tyrosine transport system substrate-binding protein
LIGSAPEAKRLDLLQQLVPGAAPIGVLVDPKYPDADLQLRELQEAAAVIKRQIVIVRTSTEPEIDASFAALARQGAGALIVAQSPFFTTRREQIVKLTARQKLPAIYAVAEFSASGGLMSYSGDVMFAYRQTGIYAGRILRGECLRTCPSCSRPSFCLSSISKPPRVSASRSRLGCWPLPTR